MVKMGWSGGGHMTNKIVTFTDRFKAASSGAGASNWISMYAQSDVRTYRTPWFGGTPWQKDAPIPIYWEHSPLKHAANVKTPTIFLVGQNDVRVPPPQSVEMYRALLAQTACRHTSTSRRASRTGGPSCGTQLFKVNVELDWFEKYATEASVHVGEGAGWGADVGLRAQGSRLRLRAQGQGLGRRRYGARTSSSIFRTPEASSIS